MKTKILILFSILCAAVALKAADSQAIGSYSVTNRLSRSDRFINSDTNRASGDRTKTISATNLLAALLATPSGAAADVNLARQTNASGLVVAAIADVNTNSYLGFALSTNNIIRAGVGSPESSITAAPGSIWMRIDGAAIGTSLYIKTNGVGNTGWWGVQ